MTKQHFAHYKDAGAYVKKDGHRMTTFDIAKELNRKSFLEENKLELEHKIENKSKTMKVQVFYNVTYNFGAYKGQSKFGWGFGVFDLSGETPLADQLLDLLDLNKDQVFNFNLTAFTPIDEINFKEE